MVSTGNDSNEIQQKRFRMIESNTIHSYIQATTPYIPNDQSEGSNKVDSLSDLMLSLQLLSL